MALVLLTSQSYACGHAAAKPLTPHVDVAYSASSTARTAPSVAFNVAKPIAGQSGIGWGSQKQVGNAAGVAWQDAAPIAAAATSASKSAIQCSTKSTVAWGNAVARQVSAGAVTRQAVSLGIVRAVAWGDAVAHVTNQALITHSAVPVRLVKRVVWGAGTSIYAGSFDPIIVPAPPPPPPPPPEQALLYILPARYFIMAHAIYIERVSDSLELPFYDYSISADVGSFCWSFSGNGHASLMQLLMPIDGVPVQIRALLDGIEFVFAVDKVSRNRSFGASGVSVSARSVTSSLSSPYALSTARSNTQGMTAYQIGTFALQDSGIDLDFGVGAGVDANGGIVDWLVPTDAFSNIGTPLQAVQSVVEAAGGYVQSHRSQPILLARHPYGFRIGDAGGAPWLWHEGSADVELAPDALITESIERSDGADINGVYVSGTTHGVLGFVKITGSDGNKLAPMVTDSLITHADAARQRGLSILGAGGKKQSIRLDLPVLVGAPHQPGILDIGQLVQVNSTTPWRGRVRAVQVNARMPALRQSVTLERYLG